MGISQCTWRSLNPISLVLVIVYLKVVFLLLRLLKDLSAVHEVTGSVHKIFAGVEMLGYIEVTCVNVCMRLVGKLLPLWSSSCLFSSYEAHSPSIPETGDHSHKDETEL